MTEWHARLTKREIDALIAAKLTASAWTVYVSLRLYVDAAGHAFPSIRSLATRTGLERRNVQIAIELLADKRLIKVKPRLNKNGAHNTNVYIVLHVASSATPPPEAETESETTPPTEAGTTPGGVAGEARVASQDTPKQHHLTDQRTDAPFGSESRARASEPRFCATNQRSTAQRQRQCVDSPSSERRQAQWKNQNSGRLVT